MSFKSKIIKSKTLCIVGVDEYTQMASCDDLGPEITQKKATGAHPFNTLQSYFSAVVDTECMTDANTGMCHVTFGGRTAQRAHDNRTLFADPAVLLRIIKPQVVPEFPEKVRIELAHHLHLVVRHGQGRVDGRWCSEKVIHDLQLISRPGGLQETEDAEGNGYEA